jgi:hypothetical protein
VLRKVEKLCVFYRVALYFLNGPVKYSA